MLGGKRSPKYMGVYCSTSSSVTRLQTCGCSSVVVVHAYKKCDGRKKNLFRVRTQVLLHAFFFVGGREEKRREEYFDNSESFFFSS